MTEIQEIASSQMRVCGTYPEALTSLSHAINTCFQKSNDYRLTAAIKLAEAKTVCAKAGVPFKSWAEREIRFSYTEATRLAKIGGADNPEQALADLRQKNRIRNKKSRTKKVVSRDATSAPEFKKLPKDAPVRRLNAKSAPDIQTAARQPTSSPAGNPTLADLREQYLAVLVEESEDIRTEEVRLIMERTGIGYRRMCP